MLCFVLIKEKKKKKEEGGGGEEAKLQRAAQSCKTCSNYGSYRTTDFSAELFDFYREISLKIDEMICPYYSSHIRKKV